jgi:hypothetical protein
MLCKIRTKPQLKLLCRQTAIEVGNETLLLFVIMPNAQQQAGQWLIPIINIILVVLTS